MEAEIAFPWNVKCEKRFVGCAKVPILSVGADDSAARAQVTMIDKGG